MNKFAIKKRMCISCTSFFLCSFLCSGFGAAVVQLCIKSVFFE